MLYAGKSTKEANQRAHKLLRIAELVDGIIIADNQVQYAVQPATGLIK